MSENCQLYSYNFENIEVKKESVSYFEKHFRSSELDNSKVHWLNFHSLENKDAIEAFCLAQGFERLSIEDIFIEVKRPKLEEYNSYFFFSIRSALPTEASAPKLNQEKINFFLGKNFLISLQQKRSDHFTVVRERLEYKKGRIRERGADFLLYRMLDAIVDNYFEVLEDISQVIETLEGLVMRSNSHSLLGKIEFQKRKLQELRKIVMPLKEIAISLDSTNSQLISTENHHYFVDLKENCLSILDEIDSNKAVLEGLANLYYAIQGQRMNEIMKVLTIVSAIFIPLTFIAGIYGMNFDNIPELHYKNGYFIVWGVMVILAIGMIVFFFKKGWLNRK